GLWCITSPHERVQDIVVTVEIKQLSLDELADELQSQTLIALDNQLHSDVIRKLLQANHLIHQAARVAQVGAS
ncbi:hypothetical protein HC761_02405, partial [bacterium]|nr:hypothetical protein [bacterium]